MSTQFSSDPVVVDAPNVKYTENEIIADYYYDQSQVVHERGKLKVIPVSTKYTFKTDRKAPRTGVMFIGWGGNNGTTVTGGIIANREGLTWETKNGTRHADYVGSLTQASTVKIGDCGKEEVYVPFYNILPMVHPNDLVVGGWDINSMNLGDGMRRARVFDVTLQDKLYPYLKDLHPLPSIYYPDFIAANQADRADNILPGDDKKQHLEKIREDIRNFKRENELDKVILLWTANTERYAALEEGINDTAENLLKSIDRNESEISASTIFAVASILEDCSYINASPQNTFVPGVKELAEKRKVFIGGNDLKSGQTKMKSVLVDFLISAGIKPVSVCSYNHLGNNDGKNLSAPQQFRSKEISKSTVIDDMVNSNRILYKEGEKPDHLVVIKYIPYVADSKRAIDEYTSEIFCGGLNTISMHNTCEDSLLAAPIILDLVLLTELMERIHVEYPGSNGFEKFDSVLSILSYLTKQPEVPKNSPVVNALFKQRECIINLLRACVGLKPDNHLLLNCKVEHSESISCDSGCSSVCSSSSVRRRVECEN